MNVFEFRTMGFTVASRFVFVILSGSTASLIKISCGLFHGIFSMICQFSLWPVLLSGPLPVVKSARNDVKKV